MSNGFSRRDFLKRSAIFGGAMAVTLATPAGLFGQRAVEAAAADNGDLAILNFAYTLEAVAVTAYKAAAGSNLLPAAAVAVANKFGAQHADHQAALAAAIKQVSGSAPTPPAGPFNFPTFKSATDILSFAKTLEETAVGAYYMAGGKFQNAQLAAAAASIIGVEAQHVAVLSAALQQDPIPSAFVTGKSAADVTTIAQSILTPPSGGQGGAAAMPSGMPTTGFGGSAQHTDDFTGAALGVLGTISVAAAAALAWNKHKTAEAETNQEDYHN